jgi:hypothetical protein
LKRFTVVTAGVFLGASISFVALLQLGAAESPLKAGAGVALACMLMGMFASGVMKNAFIPAAPLTAVFFTAIPALAVWAHAPIHVFIIAVLIMGFVLVALSKGLSDHDELPRSQTLFVLSFASAVLLTVLLTGPGLVSQTV